MSHNYEKLSEPSEGRQAKRLCPNTFLPLGQFSTFQFGGLEGQGEAKALTCRLIGMCVNWLRGEKGVLEQNPNAIIILDIL